MHLKRWLTAIVALPLLYFLIGPGPRWLFYSVIFIFSMGGLAEFYRMAAPDLPQPVRFANHLLSLVLFAALYFRQVLLVPLVLLLWSLVTLTFFLFVRPGPDARGTGEMGKGVLGPLYVTVPLSLFLLIDMQPGGKTWIFFLLCVIFAGDSGAFYAGKLFGSRKLYEAVSPAKTWEGALGGLFCSIVVAYGFHRLIPMRCPVGHALVLGGLLCIAGQVGDLAESMLKRNHGIKDSSGMLPGHGGILDRIDGVLFAIPLLYGYLLYTMA
ncbi:MAG: phosphatidate cytidylyltransferase [Deltaproteobacteria bacterium]|nr:phosphatidate cytidylyltransferase [Deltaproteobacteria bacterium]MBW1922128.1 phosphatidate cytidylyltransferase [Deltaproteobacteria bacterium]MBW1947945.1 phosphatidate cytidylyltransferase [Deltaproteobacteria bacterium]MBW2007320.1 phosphatidate cytidylyltransferase [Deltaproteobacteria bacterium]MBW2102378.1 phosphatidate cytidylyltransferase [Deltaproteobacteria bacterium]